MLADAAEASGDERNMALRRLGDVALFVAGFMADCLDRSPVGINYYVRMGGGAYHYLSVALPSSMRGRAIAPVYAELSERCVDLVDVLPGKSATFTVNGTVGADAPQSNFTNIAVVDNVDGPKDPTPDNNTAKDVDVLTEVRHLAGSSRDRDILRLYELWLTTGSQRAARLLRLLGIEPSQQSGSAREH
jgi:hypothetical protein